MRKAIVYWNEKKQTHTVLNATNKRKIADIDDVILLNTKPYSFEDKDVTAYTGFLVEKFSRKAVWLVRKSNGPSCEFYRYSYGPYKIPNSAAILFEKDGIKTVYEYDYFSEGNLAEFNYEE